MLYLNKFCLRSFLFCSFILLVHAQADNYGPYKIQYKSYGKCRDEKVTNATVAMIYTSWDENLNSVLNLTAFSEFKIDVIKTRARSLNQKKSIIWNYTTNDPCKQVIYKVLMNKTFNTDNNCIVKPGFYIMKLNFGDIMNNMVGKKFFYGTYSFKSEVIVKKKVMICVSSVIEFSRKM